MEITLIIIASVVLVLSFLMIRARKRLKSIQDLPDHHRIQNLTDQNFANKIKTGTVLVDFWAEWCMPCKLMVPVLNELSEEVNGSVTISKLNVDTSQKTASAYGIRSIPTMILFRNGKEVKRMTGVKTKDYLLRELDRLRLK
jgi:thioredoxin 1